MKYLLVGCTGALGQSILHNLLVNTKHYLVIAIREKNNKTIQQRIKYILSCVNLNYIEYKDRIKLIHCEYDEKRNIIIDDVDRSYILNHIEIFVNALADINFNRELKKATLNNCATALYWLELYNECEKVRQYTYVSTAFTGFHSGWSREARRASPLRDTDLTSGTRATKSREARRDSDNEVCSDIKEELHIIPECGHTIERCMNTYYDIERGVIGDNDLRMSVFENSYTYTKNLTELLLAKNIRKGKLYIVRPSIIVSAIQEPYRGWGKFQTFNAIMLGIISGKCLYYCFDYRNNVVNTVPVDMAANDCVRVLDDVDCLDVQGKLKILHSCLTHNSEKWNEEDLDLFSGISDYIYKKFTNSPLVYQEKVIYPSKMLFFTSVYEYIYLLFVIIRQFILNVMNYGMYNAFCLIVKQLIFTWKYNQIFTPFSRKNCRFVRKDDIKEEYKMVTQKQLLYDFIDNVPNLINDEQPSCLKI